MALVARVGGLTAAAVASRSFSVSDSFGGKKKTTSVRVVSYNVLSDSLCAKGELLQRKPPTLSALPILSTHWASLRHSTPETS